MIVVYSHNATAAVIIRCAILCEVFYILEFIPGTFGVVSLWFNIFQ